MLFQQKLLIVEDMFLIAMDIQRAVEDAGAEPAVLARTFAEADLIAQRFGEFDLAIINPPSDETEMRVVERLAAAGPAILVCTGARTSLGATPLADAEVLMKPFADGDLVAACARAIAKRGR